MKICIYSPYIPKHFGGGEKYLFDVAQAFMQEHEVYFAIPKRFGHLSQKKQAEIRKSYEKFLNVDLSKVQFIASPLGTKAGFLKKLLWTKHFDLLYYGTDGSLFFSLAKKNCLHIQVPFKLDKSSLIEKLKLANWQIKNTNSKFTKKIIEKYWQTKIDFVHQPMVNLTEIQGIESGIGSAQKSVKLSRNKESKKEKIILNVGRFFRQLHSKRQNVLVDAFKQLLEKYPKKTKGWKLILVGSVEDKEYAGKIKKMAQDLPIEIHHNVSRKKLIDWYKKASIYWHATGFGFDQLKYPEKMEHFGITTIEAMAAGCVPIVIAKGGQVEILGSDLKDCSWRTKEQLIAKTERLIINQYSLKNKSKMAMERAERFGQEKFRKLLKKHLT